MRTKRSNTQTHQPQNNIHVSTVHCGSAFELGFQAPCYCTPPVCVPDVLCALNVWRQNTPKNNDNWAWCNLRASCMAAKHNPKKGAKKQRKKGWLSVWRHNDTTKNAPALWGHHKLKAKNQNWAKINITWFASSPGHHHNICDTRNSNDCIHVEGVPGTPPYPSCLCPCCACFA